MNYYFLTLWLILLIIIIIIIYYNIYSLYKYYNSLNINTVIIDNCTKSLDTLVDVTNIPNCIISNKESIYKYVPELNMVVSTIPNLDYQSICLQNCEDTSCSNYDQKLNYNECIKLLEPINCKGVYPVAHSGTDFYYAYAIGSDFCIRK